MFFKQNIFERLLKEAYKTCGIYISHRTVNEEYGAYQIAGTNWAVWIRDDKITKEAKAAIIKLCGDLPVLGEAFLAKKDYENQYEIGDIHKDLQEELKECEIRMQITKLMARRDGGLIRFLQSEECTVAINQVIVDLVDKNAVDRDTGEEEPCGPLIESGNSLRVYWGNEESCLMTIRLRPREEEEEFWKELSKLTII